MEKEDFVRVPLFDGSNYPAWKYRMRVVLEEHDLTDCIEREMDEIEELAVKAEDSDATRQAKAKEAEKRKKQERRCKSLLISRIHDSQLEYVQDHQTPKAIWLALQRVFERKSVASRLHLKRKMLTLRHEGGPLSEHFLIFDKIVREYKSTGAQLDDLDVVCHLLLTLGPTFATVVTALETMPEEMLTLEFVKCRLLDEEIKQHGGGTTTVGSSSEPAAFSGSSGKQRQRQHQQQQKKKWKCFGCQQEGHKVSECPEKNKKKDKASKKNSAYFGEDAGGVCFVGGQKLPENPAVTWIVDSGSSEHLTNNRALLHQLSPMKDPMTIAVAKEGESIVAKHKGEVRLTSVVHGKSIPVCLKNVLYIPDARVNLLSVRKMEMAGLTVTFADGKVLIRRGSEVVAVGERRGKLYELNLSLSEGTNDSSFYSCGRVPKEMEIWHRRFGHLSAKGLEQLVRNDMVRGLKTNVRKSSEKIVCEACVAGKLNRKPFVTSEGRQSSRVLELIHSDVCGPVTPVGVGGERYFVTFIDDWSRFTVVFLLNSKDQVLGAFRDYVATVSAKFGSKISRLRCDNGGEYKNGDFLNFCKQNGIQVEFTVPYTPEQNGVSERKNRTLVEMARAMLEDSGADRRLWGSAIQTAAFVTNRCPARALDPKLTPFEVWEGRKPNVDKLRKSWKGVFVGYSPNGYRIWDPKRKRIVVARDVIFVEEKTDKADPPGERTACSGSDLLRVPVDTATTQCSDGEKSEAGDNEEGVAVEDDSFDSCEDDSVREESEPEPQGSMRPVRNRSAPAWHDDYEFDMTGFALNATSFVEDLPCSVAEMRKRDDWPKWETAIREEINALKRNHTWDLVELPAGRKPISCKWVFKIKRNDDGSEGQYKARLVARGFTQRQGFDYSETYSPTARLDTLRTVLAVANHERMCIHQMDVKSAFLNGSITEEIFMTQPEGFDEGNGLVCRLNRSLYGLKQASRAWNERFHVFVEKLGFRRSTSDKCLYIRESGGQRLFLIIYVDDVLLVGHKLKEILVVKKCFSNEFEMKDIGEVNCFLGMKIERNVQQRVLRVSQRAFLERLLQRFNMSDCKPVSTPIENRLRLQRGDESKRTNKPYRELVGCLVYVTLTTRPDLSAAVNYYSQFQSCPTDEHWGHLKRVLRYIRGTLDLGIQFEGDDNAPIIEAYSDADWGNDTTDRRSLTGYVFRVYGCTTSWITRKQSTVSLSSTEAELIALCMTVCHGIWVVRLLEDLGIKLQGPVIYHEDNQSAIRVVEEERDTGRLKHIDIKFRFVRDHIQRGLIQMKYVPTNLQPADIMTKGLPAKLFLQHRTALGMRGSGN